MGDILFYGICILLYILMLFGIVSAYYRLNRRYNRMEREILQEIRSMRENNSFDKAEESELKDKDRELLHDMVYHLRQICIYAEKNQVEKIKEKLSDLQIEVGKRQQETVCSDDFLNDVLLDFKERAMRDGVCVHLFTEAGFQIEGMKETDLNIVLGNLLDNALEATVKCEKKEICVDLFMQNQGALSVIRIENTYKGDVQQKDGVLISTKGKGGNHGIGIKSAMQKIEKYGGHLHQDFLNGICRMTVVVPTDS